MFVLGSFTLKSYSSPNDVFLKKILLFNVDNNYYKLIINNVITIVIIDFLIYLIHGNLKNKS